MTLVHTIWYCPHFEPIRTRVDPGIARLNPGILPACLKIGITPAMSMTQGTTYWGSHIEDHSAQDAVTLGISDPGPSTAEAKDLLSNRPDKKHNARQYMACMRADDGSMVMPDLPPPVNGKSPTNPNLYGDGGLANPTKQQFAVGGFGLFWPNDENTDDELDIHEKTRVFTRHDWDTVNTSVF